MPAPDETAGRKRRETPAWPAAANPHGAPRPAPAPQLPGQIALPGLEPPEDAGLEPPEVARRDPALEAMDQIADQLRKLREGRTKCDQCREPATTSTWFRCSWRRRDGTWVYASTKRCDAHPFQLVAT